MNDQLAVRQESQIVPHIGIADMKEMATSIVESGLFGGIKTESQAMTLMLLSQAKGMHPVLILEDYDIVAGRPAMKSQRMLAKFQQAGGVIRWLQRDDETCKAEFSHPSSPEPVVVEWTMKMAAKAGLANKDIWRQYPRAMLSNRVISEGVYPAAIGGDVYTPDEIENFDAKPLTAASKARAKKETKAMTVQATVVETKTAEAKPAEDPKPKVKTDTIVELKDTISLKGIKASPSEVTVVEEDEIPGLETVKDTAKEEILPSGPPSDLPEGLEFIAGHEAKVTPWLVRAGWLEEGKKIKDLTALHKKKIRDRPDAFKAAVGI